MEKPWSCGLLSAAFRSSIPLYTLVTMTSTQQDNDSEIMSRYSEGNRVRLYWYAAEGDGVYHGERKIGGHAPYRLSVVKKIRFERELGYTTIGANWLDWFQPTWSPGLLTPSMQLSIYIYIYTLRETKLCNFITHRQYIYMYSFQ